MPSYALPATAGVVVVGAGFAGICAAVRLAGAALDGVLVLERAAELGGTWRDNTYPGCACDIPSHLYSFSFAPNPSWRHAFARREEIQDYLRATAERFGVLSRIRFGTELRDASWNGDRRRWRVETDRGTVEARVLVLATGPLVEPAVPAVPGMDGFAGPVFHSARWDHRQDLTGRRVAVLGTGASAIQLVPELAGTASRLVVLQRTPPWVLPRPDRATTGWERRLFRAAPVTQWLLRQRSYWLRELLVPGVARQGRGMRLLRAVATLHLRSQIRDPALRRALTPDYAIGCKRILVSSDYFPALRRPDVELVTAPVREVEPAALVTADGVRRPVDAIVLATGFEVRPPPVSERVRGVGGRRLADTWGDSPQAYLGTTVAGFPNLFVLVGPNSVGGLGSVVFVIESQVRYVAAALRAMDRHRLDAVDVRASVQAAFNERLRAEMAGSVWTDGGCASYYLDSAGRNTALWPDYTWRFRRRTRRFDLGSYVATPARPGTEFGAPGTGPP